MMIRSIAGLWLLLGALLTCLTGAALAQSNVVILSTTTSTQDSGLLDVLVPMFEKQSGLSVKTISVGTGQALALAARGEADVTLAHAPGVEKKYVEDGKMSNRRLVMYNDFVIIGPPDDPARTSPAPTCWSRGCGSRPASSPEGPGTSSPGRAWARPSASPTTGAPTP
jgi:tungstate transport system substrate-binding protein